MAIFSFTGPSSSGKSTLLTECKHKYSNKFTYVEEITRKIKNKGLPINEQGSDLTQLLIINSHIENSLLKNAMLDRCIIDGLVYTQYLYNHGQVGKRTLDYAEYVYSILRTSYDIIFYTEPVELKDDGVRSTSSEFRNETIELFDTVFKTDTELARKVIRLSGSVTERLKQIDQAVAVLT